ncbi:putative FAD-binding PCMH-type domain-containing protein [Seiridium cardinale]
MRFETFVPIVLAKLASAACASNNVSALFAGHLSPDAGIYYPSDADYAQEITQRHTLFDDPSYYAAIKPATVEDVQNIVKIANEHNISYLATGGAHGANIGFAKVRNAIDIDLGNFNFTTLDTDTNLLTVGAANSFSDFFDLLYNAGKEIQTGNAPCVNMIGATIGAGVGPLQGLHGLIIDALRSVVIVTASGDALNASSTENPDLFWAIRGAGANFGIITQATYEVHDATNNGQLINADFAFSGAANGSLWELLNSWDSDEVYPKEMGMSIIAGFNHTSGLATMSANVAFFGPYEAAKPYLDQLVAVGPLLWQNESVGWNVVTNIAGFGNAKNACIRGSYNNHFMVGVKQTDVAAYTSFFNDFAAWNLNRPWFGGSLVFQRYNAAAAQALPESERGAYPWRDIGTLIAFDNVYDNSSHDDEVNAFFIPEREKLYAASGFDSPHIYLNYGYGDEGPEAWYGPSLPRLISLKQQWDPQGKFGPANPVPLS